jgi:methionine-rich copper-binding protein CopC
MSRRCVTRSDLTVLVLRVSAVAAAAGLALLGSAGLASAAAKNPQPIGFSPMSVAMTVPEAVSVTFAKSVKAGGASLTVIAENGDDIGRGKVRTGGNALTRNVSGKAVRGHYRLVWKAVLKNGQKVHGSHEFVLNIPAPASGPAGQPIPSDSPSPAEVVATPDPTPSTRADPTPSSSTGSTGSPSPQGTLSPAGRPGTTLAAAAPGDSHSGDHDGGVSSGFTVIPLAVGAVLVIVAGLIARFNRPGAQVR